MPRSDSGRVVIDLDPEFKRELYSALKEDESNLKTWFLEKATDYVEDKRQPSLFATQSIASNARNDSVPSPSKRKGGSTS